MGELLTRETLAGAAAQSLLQAGKETLGSQSKSSCFTDKTKVETQKYRDPTQGTYDGQKRKKSFVSG